MEQLKSMKQCLMAQVQSQMGNLQQVDAKELGEAIDMIKDLEEAIYYCTIVEAMGKDNKEKEVAEHYYPGNYPMPKSDPWYYTERPAEIPMRDPREGRSPMQRRTYMESKEKHKDSTVQMHELESYIQELTNDIMEMISDATPEERQTLRSKISMLASKI